MIIERSLQLRIMLFTGIIILTIIGFSTFLYVHDFRKNYLEAIEWRSVTLAQSMHKDIQSRYDMFGAVADSRLILESAYLQCKKLYDANRTMHVSFICILSESGHVVIHNDRAFWGRQFDQPGLLTAIRSHLTRTISIDKDYHTLIPIIAGNGVFLGTIDVGFPKRIMTLKMVETMRNAVLLCLVLFPATFFPVWLFIKKSVTRPITGFIEATSDIAEGHLTRDIPLSRTREFKKLSLSLTHMRDSIRRSMDKLAQKNQEIQALITCSPVALFGVDTTGNIFIWTESAERLFGWKSFEIMGKPLPGVPDEEDKRFEDLFTKVCQGRVLMGQRFRLKQKDGSLFEASLSSAPIRDGRDHILGMMGAMEDITERIEREKAHQEVQEQLVQARKMESVGRLAGGVAHDYNNMLAVILGYAELVLESLKPDDPMQDYMKEIIKATNHSTDITRQLLAFARKQTISPEVLNVNRRIENTLKMLRRLIGENISLQWIPQVNLVPVHMDKTQLDQILTNLCLNARDAIGDVGQITIETRQVTIDEDYCGTHPDFKPGEFVCLTVSDTGFGMDKAILDNVFEPFFTTKDLGKGTGLGLATVYGIVKQNDGFINVYSEPGKGATFTIYIPVHAGSKKVPKSPRIVHITLGKGEMILLVEDELSILKMNKLILENLGYRVLTAQTPRAALDLAQAQKDNLSLLITDVILPDMNGRELAEQIKILCPGLAILYMSGYTANVIAHRGILEDGVNFLQKPFSRKALASKIQHILKTSTQNLAQHAKGPDHGNNVLKSPAPGSSKSIKS